MADANDTRLQEIERSVGTLETTLRDQIARSDRGKRVTLIVGVIVIAVVFTYLAILTSMLKEYANAKDMAGILAVKANEYARDQVPQIADSLKKSAPDVVAGLREQAVKNIPQAREYAEEKTLVLVDRFTAKMETSVDKIVAEMIKQHKGELQPLIEAAATKGNAEALEKDFQKALEELIGPEMDAQFASFNKDMDAVQAKLAYYAQPDEKLTADERAHKYLIIAVLGFINENVAQPTKLAPAAPAKPAAPTAPAPAAPAAKL